MLVPGQGMADQNRIGFVRIQRAITLIGDLQRGQFRACGHLQAVVCSKPHNKAAGRARFFQRRR